ncbi:MAG: glycosyltransferase, partial [Verrucomicrobia bacterium]|nr:glycosyltransferase [Verrucomicrobiota bacterium]
MDEKLVEADLIVSSYNNGEAVVQILSFLNKGSVTPTNVHIADDGSSEESRNQIQSKLSEFSIPVTCHWHEDQGFRKARILNEAIRACESNYVVFLDGDCLPHKHFVRDHLTMAEKGYFVQGRRCFVQEDQVVSLLE